MASEQFPRRVRAPAPATSAVGRRPRVFVLSALRLLREGIAAALARQATVEVVGLGDMAIEAAEIAGFQPDVILLDVYVPGMLSVAPALRRAMTEARIVVLGAAEVEPVVMACARAGVAGFVGPEGSAHDVVTAIHSAVRGELVCSPRLAAMLLHGMVELVGADPVAAPPDLLTPRERETLGLMSEGLSNKQIARRLGIHDATVKNHVHSILGKLGVSRRGEAVARLLGAPAPAIDATPPAAAGL